MVQGLPMFGGALVLILGALAVGSGYGWGTWKTVFTTGPRRGCRDRPERWAHCGLIVADGRATFGLDLLASYAVATAESQPVTWPGAWPSRRDSARHC